MSLPKKYQDLANKIKELPVDDRLQEHLAWIKKYRLGKARSKRGEIKRRMLKIADDIRFWATQIAIENNDIASLLSLTEDIYNRYEDKPKIAGDSMDDEYDIGGVVYLPPIKEINVVKRKKTKDSMETS